MATEVSGSSLTAFRVGTGLLGAVASLRFLAEGWVDDLWVRPAHYFHWPGLGWVQPLPGGTMKVFVAAVAAAWLASAAGAALDRRSLRWAGAGATVGFAYLGAIDVATYLNHYVLLVVAGGLCVVLPDGPRVPGWTVWVPRYVIGTTYVWAAVAKLDPDWLSGATVRPWLAANHDLPAVGTLLRHHTAATSLSWAGLVFDAAVVPLLLWRRSRPLAYLLVVGFHACTAVLFPIGMFPWIMIVLTPIFFAPGWAARWLPVRPVPRASRPSAERQVWLRRATVAAVVVLSLVPLRSVVGDTWWSEQGGRFSWRVMASDKVGLAELWVVPVGDAGRPTRVRPEQDLSPLQAQQVTWQPDLLLQWAHLVARQERRRLDMEVQVHADVWVAVNGRPAARLVDPEVDLARQEWTPGRPAWVLEAPRR